MSFELPLSFGGFLNQGDSVIYCCKRNHPKRSGFKHAGLLFLMILWVAWVILPHVMPARTTHMALSSWKLSGVPQSSFTWPLSPHDILPSTASSRRARLRARQASTAPEAQNIRKYSLSCACDSQLTPLTLWGSSCCSVILGRGWGGSVRPSQAHWPFLLWDIALSLDFNKERGPRPSCTQIPPNLPGFLTPKNKTFLSQGSTLSVPFFLWKVCPSPAQGKICVAPPSLRPCLQTPAASASLP